MTTAPIAVTTPPLPAAQQLLVLLKSSGFVEQPARGQRVFKCFHGEHAGKTFVMRRPDRDAFQNLERILASTAPEPRSPQEPSSITAQKTVDRLMDAVAAAQTEEEVKQAVQDTFAPAQPSAPTKRGRGRPRKYAGDTEQERERNRKRIERSEANQRLVKLLRYFELEVASQIPPGLKTKYQLEVNTYRELLDSGRVENKVIREIASDLKMIGAITTPTSGALSAGNFMPDAPSGKGKLIYSNKPGAIHDRRRQQEAALSKPGDPEEYLVPGTTEPTQGDRRRVRPKGRGPDTDPQDGE